MTLLSVRGLTVRAGDLTLVDDVSFDVDEGEVLCLVGESGSGKSITVSAVLGLLPAGVRITAGEVLFQDRDLRTLPARELRRLRGSEIAAVFQDPMTSLNPVIRIGNQVGETVRLHRPTPRGALRERVRTLLGEVGITTAGAERRYPHEFSGGMRQRTMIAMAAANSPKLLVADEPTTALDVTVQAQVLDHLRAVRERTGSALILVTHDLGVVAQNADRVAVVYGGRIVETGTVQEIFDAPRHPYTAGLLASVLDMESDLAAPAGEAYAIPGRPPTPDDRPPGCVFHPRCDRARDRCGVDDPVLVAERPGRAAACWYPVEGP